MLLALSGGQKAGLVAAAAVFIGFALASSFLFSRRNPDFPGRKGLPWFVLASILLFAGMMSAMVVFAAENEEAGAGQEQVQATGEGGGGTAGGGTATGGGETAGGGAPQGDPQAGAQVFASAGCVACHTLKAAGATGSVGPNLDEAKPPHELVVERVTNGKSPMPSFKGQLSEQQIQDVAAYVVASTSK